jgi:hypothetical protein
VNQWLIVGVIAACTLLEGCASATKGFELAEGAVRQFHSQLDSEQYSAIYQSADVKMKKSISESDFASVLREVHSKLGSFQSSSQPTKTFVYRAPHRATVKFDYDTTFARGTATEKFTWEISDNFIVLGGYKIDSSEIVARVPR